jgi:Tol biopolymer transport system component
VRISSPVLILGISVVAAPYILQAWHASSRSLPGTSPAAQSDATEQHLSNVRQLTFEGENAEAYFSFDGRRLILQSTRGGAACDQIYKMNVDGTGLTRVSSGKGRTTCGFFYPDGTHILYASTVRGGDACPPKPDFSRGYVWPVYETYDIYRANADGSGLEALTSTPGYDAEATIAKDGTIVFTSVRDGDMEIYSMNPDGSNVRRLTQRPGPDGGPFFSPDGSQIVFRGRQLSPGKELDDYQLLLKAAVWRPTALEIFVMNRDGSNVRQVTNLKAASFAPYWYPDGRRIIFASNHHDPKGREFEIWGIDIDGSNLERITHNPTFDGFPMFSPDGRQLVFASNRHAAREGETNVFLADWKD